MKQFQQLAPWLLISLMTCVAACAPVVSSNGVQATTGTPVFEPPIVITINEFLHDYSTNELAANNKYKDKIVELSATVYELSEGSDGICLALVIDTKSYLEKYGALGGFTNTYCYDFPDSSRAALSQLKVGGPVTVVGRVSYTGRFTLCLRECGVKSSPAQK